MSVSFINANNLCIDFPIYNASHRSLKTKVLKATTGGVLHRNTAKTTVIRAIDNATFNLRSGDRVGVVGHNGAGKSTLLRVLAGVYAPTSGTLEIEGRVTSLLDIALGMESESTGYENIVLRGLLLGLSPKEINEAMEEIAAFSELGEYLDMPLRTYSSGMLLRLAFSISTCKEVDILLMDEWLSVGDAAFNKKASEKLDQIISNSSILIFASHSTDMIKKLCTRAFKADHGHLEEIELATL